MRESQDYYQLLGVPKNAEKKDIQKAYRRLARKYHPDINNDRTSAEKFKDINEAHSILIDPEKRKLYDLYGHNWKEAQDHQESGRKRGGFNGAGHWQRHDSGFTSHGDSSFTGRDFSDIFSSIFGSKSYGEPGWQQQTANGQTIEAEIGVSLGELLRGATKTLSWKGSYGNDAGGVETVKVKIPKGLRDGSVIRLAGKGAPGGAEGKRGDLLLRVNILPDAIFSVDGYDILTTVPVTPWEAALGGKVKVQTLDGDINLTIPRGCQTGRKMRVKGKGLPKKRGGAGELLVVVEIQVPDSLTGDERQLFEKLQYTSQFNPREQRGQRAPVAKRAA